MCAVMVLVVAAPLVLSQAGDEHMIVKYEKGPRASAVTWVYEPIEYGIWTGHIVNEGLRSLVVDVFDTTTGVPEEVMSQRIRFAAYDAYPSGVIDTDPVEMARGHTYEITGTPNGPQTSYCIVTDMFESMIPPVAAFAYSVDGAILSVNAGGSYDLDGTIVAYDWSWGDGSSGSGLSATHTYAMDGTYDVTLTVTDDDTLTGTDTKAIPIDVANMPPVAMFGWSAVSLTVDVDGSGSYDPDGTIESWVWDWGDSSAVGSGEMASHTYLADGTYDVILTVTDNEGLTDTETLPVTVAEVKYPPSASFTVSAVELVVSVNAGGSTDSDGVIVSYEWDWGDLSMMDSGVLAAHTYAMDGTYTITLKVTDDDGLWDTDAKSVPVASKKAPVASFTWSALGLRLDVNAGASYDPDGTIESWDWDWGDGSMGSGETAFHVYSTAGDYTVILTVTDNDMMTDTASDLVTVEEIQTPPTASFTVSVDFLAVSVNGGSSSDLDGTIVSYSWDWGDGSMAGSGVTASHTYAAEGTYRITLTVTDDDGLIGSDWKDVPVVAMKPPVAVFSVSSVYLVVDVDGGGSYDLDGTIVSYSWGWGDGSMAGSGVTTTHTYAMGGVYTITLTVTDNHGLTGEASEDVTVVANQPPVADFSWSADGLSVSVNGGLSSDADGSIVSYAWTWDDGASSSGATASHTYGAGGTYTITLTVTDNAGATGSKSEDVTVVDPNAMSTSYTISNMFELYLKPTDYSELGRWSDTMGVNSYQLLRQPGYDEWMVSTQYPFLLAYDPYSTVTSADVAAGNVITTWYRLTVDAKNLPGLTTTGDPYFVPQIGNPALPGGNIQASFYSTYLTTQEMTDLRLGTHYGNTYYGVPIRSTPLASQDDGYWHEWQGVITFDRDAAKRSLGLPGAGDLRTEFAASEATIEGIWWDDLINEGSAGGQFDIYTAYDYNNDVRWVELKTDPLSTADSLVIRFYSISWGNDVMLLRYCEAAGILENFQCWMDDWYLNMTISPTMGNIESRSVNGYHMTSWQDQGSPDLGAWMIEPVHIDWAGNYGQHTTYISPYNAYDPDQTDVLRMSYLPGTMNFGQRVSYWLAPREWDLAAGVSITVKLPGADRQIAGVTPYVSDTDFIDDYKIAEIQSHVYLGELALGTCVPSTLSDHYDAGTKTLSLVGPMDMPTNTNALYPSILETGTPFLVFNVQPSAMALSEGAEPLSGGVAAMEPVSQELVEDVMVLKTEAAVEGIRKK